MTARPTTSPSAVSTPAPQAETTTTSPTAGLEDDVRRVTVTFAMSFSSGSAALPTNNDSDEFEFLLAIFTEALGTLFNDGITTVEILLINGVAPRGAGRRLSSSIDVSYRLATEMRCDAGPEQECKDSDFKELAREWFDASTEVAETSAVDGTLAVAIVTAIDEVLTRDEFAGISAEAKRLAEDVRAVVGDSDFVATVDAPSFEDIEVEEIVDEEEAEEREKEGKEDGKIAVGAGAAAAAIIFVVGCCCYAKVTRALARKKRVQNYVDKWTRSRIPEQEGKGTPSSSEMTQKETEVRRRDDGLLELTVWKENGAARL